MLMPIAIPSAVSVGGDDLIPSTICADRVLRFEYPGERVGYADSAYPCGGDGRLAGFDWRLYGPGHPLPAGDAGQRAR